MHSTTQSYFHRHNDYNYIYFSLQMKPLSFHHYCLVPAYLQAKIHC